MANLEMQIGVLGAGYVGLIQAVGLAELGFNVTVYDIDPSKIKKLQKGEPPIYEKDLEGLLKKNIGRLQFTTNLEKLKGSEVFFICVGTPQDSKGKANLNFVFSAAENLKPLLSGKEIVVLKSTVPVGTNRKVQQLLGDRAYVVSNPEFLREGIAVYDFFNPERVVLGFGENSPEWVKEKIFNLYRYFQEKEVPFVVTDWESAELIKYASNTFLAMKISFINELARLAEKTGADIRDIAKGMGLDSRIGPKFLNAGIGWGGSCFHPKEVLFVEIPGKGIRAIEFHQLERFKNVPLKVVSAKDGKLTTERVKLFTKRFYSGEIYKIKLPLGREIKVTHDHPMLVYKNGTFEVVLAKDLKEGNLLALPTGGLENKASAVADTLELLTRTGETVRLKTSRRLLIKEFATVRGFLKGRRYPHDVKRTGVLTATEVLEIESRTDLRFDGRVFTVRNGINSIPRKVELNGDLARLLGYFAAEGWITEENTRKGYKRLIVGFTFHRGEKEYTDDLKGILENLQIPYSEQVRNNSKTIKVSSKPFVLLLKEYFQTGSDSYNKRVPPQILFGSKEIKREFLKGYLRGDGAITKVNGGKNLYIEFAIASKELAYGLLLLLQSLGIVASIRVKRFNKSKVETYLLRVNGYDQLKELLPLFGSKAGEYLKILENYSRKGIKQPSFKRSGDWLLLKVEKIEKEHYEGFVYSLETESSTLVAGGGIYVHNCFPKDVSALIWQFKEHELEPKLPKATKEINEEQIIWFFNKIKRHFAGDLSGKTFTLLGLAFKPNTDDLRESVALKLAELLIEEGAFVKGFDFVEGARENVRRLIELKTSTRYSYAMGVYDNVYEAIEGSNGIIVAVEYKEWNSLDWNLIGEKVKGKNLFDGRNVINPDLARELIKKGWHYEGVGVKKWNF